jgi:hypothetical protein
MHVCCAAVDLANAVTGPYFSVPRAAAGQRSMQMLDSQSSERVSC